MYFINVEFFVSGDTATQNLSFWSRFEDPCRECVGEDKPWTVGTEHRQPKMSSPLVQDRHELRKIMLDDVQRRHFFLDADVMVMPSSFDVNFVELLNFFSCIHIHVNSSWIDESNERNIL